MVTAPGAGDCSYCGLALDLDGDLAMSHDSQPERLPLPSDGRAGSDVPPAPIRR